MFEQQSKSRFHKREQLEGVFATGIIYRRSFSCLQGKKGGSQKTPSILYTEDLLKWYNEKAIDMGMGDTC